MDSSPDLSQPLPDTTGNTLSQVFTHTRLLIWMLTAFTSFILVGMIYYMISIQKQIEAISPESRLLRSLSPTPVPQDTSTWKTYTNTKYGFSVQYPPHWKLTTDNYINTIKDYLLFSIFPITRGGSRIELYKDFQGGFCEGPSTVERSVIIFNNSIQGKKTACPDTIAINFQKNGSTFWLIAYTNNETQDSFNHILSTFTFLK